VLLSSPIPSICWPIVGFEDEGHLNASSDLVGHSKKRVLICFDQTHLDYNIELSQVPASQ
jgi:hypothetical protein